MLQLLKNITIIAKYVAWILEIITWENKKSTWCKTHNIFFSKSQRARRVFCVFFIYKMFFIEVDLFLFETVRKTSMINLLVAFINTWTFMCFVKISHDVPIVFLQIKLFLRFKFLTITILAISNLWFWHLALVQVH